MRRSRLALPIAAAGLLALPASGLAAPPWNAPLPARAASGASALKLGLTFADRGGLLTFDTTTDLSRVDASLRGRQARLSLAGQSRVVVRTLDSQLYPGPEIMGEPQAYGSTRSLLAFRRKHGTRDGVPLYDVGVRFGRVDEVFSDDGVSRKTLQRRAVGLEGPVLATNAKGDSALVWTTTDHGRSRLWLSERRAGGSFRSPSVIVGSGEVDGASLAAAVSPGGDVVVAFGRRKDRVRRVEARVRRHGHSIGSVQELGPNRGIAQVDAAMGDTGRTVVAWQTFDAGEEVNGPTKVYGAVRPAGPRTFRRATTLEPGGPSGGVGSTVAVGAAPDGTATVGWTARTSASRSDPLLHVRYATVGVDARFGPARDLPGAHGALRDVVASRGPQGVTALAFSAAVPQEGADGALFVALRSRETREPDSAFAVPELVSKADDRTEGASLAFPPGSDTPTAAWFSRAGGGERQAVRVARRENTPSSRSLRGRR